MASVSMALRVSVVLGVVEVDAFRDEGESGNIFLEVFDPNGSGCVILTPEQAKTVAAALLRAAS